MKKIISTFFVLFIIISNLFLPISVFTYYEYQNAGGSKTTICEKPDILTCSTELKQICGATTTASCVETQDGCSYMQVAPVCPASDVHNLNPLKDGNNKDGAYRLLAPIGEFQFAPDDIGGYFNTILSIAIGLCAVLAVIMIVIGGVQYMGDESIFGKTQAKDRIGKAILGLLIALGSYALLNTINPDLLGGNINIKQVSVEIVYDRANDTAFMQNLDSYSTSNITINPSDYNDSIFLGYMAHQQGAAGASAILWAAKKGYSEVPANNPFTKSDINRNMRGNFNANSAQQTIGTSILTPDNFLKYWATKVMAIKNKTTPAIFPAIETELNKVATETGIGIITLRTICRIESAAGCTQQSSITTVNSGGYAGLFQLSNKTYQSNRNTDGVWETYKKSNGVLLDAYHNAFAAAKYFSANLNEINKNMSKINN